MTSSMSPLPLFVLLIAEGSVQVFMPRVALLKRAIAYIDLKHIEEALRDLENLIQNDPTNSEAHYFRGTLLEKKSIFNHLF